MGRSRPAVRYSRYRDSRYRWPLWRSPAIRFSALSGYSWHARQDPWLPLRASDRATGPPADHRELSANPVKWLRTLTAAEPGHGRAHTGERGFVLGEPLALLLDHLGLGLGEELPVAKLAIDLVEFAGDRLGLLLEPLPLLAEVDRVREVEKHRGAFDRHLNRLARDLLPASPLGLLDFLEAGEPLDGVEMRRYLTGHEPTFGANKRGDLLRRRHVHFRPDRPDRCDQRDHPLHLSDPRSIALEPRIVRPARGNQTAAVATREMFPHRFRDEGADRVQEMRDLRQSPGGRGTCLYLRRGVGAVEDRLRKFKIQM